MGNSLFDDGLQIKWIDEELPTEPIEQGYRKNVCQYDHSGNKIEYQDDANNKPVEVPRLKIQTIDEQAKWDAAEKRIELRKQRRDEGF